MNSPCPSRDELEMCTNQTVFHKIVLCGSFDNISFPKNFANITQIINAKDSMGLTALHYAVLLKRITCIRFLFEFNKTLSEHKIMVSTNTEITDGNAKTPLYYAIKLNEYAITNMLLKNNTNPNAIDKLTEDTPLHYAIREKSLPIVKLLLKYNIVINAINKFGESPLLLCTTENCDINFFIELLENGADVNIAHPISNKTPLHYAVAANLKRIVEYLINVDDIDFNVTDIRNETPLHYAVQMCNLDLVKLFLIEKFSNNNIIAMRSIVQLSIKKRCIEIFKYIYEHPNNRTYILNATFNAKLFHYAIQIKYKEVVAYFLQFQRIRIDLIDIQIRNALFYAVIYNYEEIIDTLLENGFPLDRYDIEGKIPLYWAIYYKRENIICKFLKYTVNINDWKFENNYDNLLNLAIKYQLSNYILQKIINFGINSNDVNVLGQTPLHYTIIYHNATLVAAAPTDQYNNEKYYKNYNEFIANKTIQIIEMLRKKNCNINAIDNAGKTPLYYSIEYKLLKVIKYLLINGGATIDHSNIFIRQFYKSEINNINNIQYAIRYKIIKFISIYLINENRHDLNVIDEYFNLHTNISFYFIELTNMLKTNLNYTAAAAPSSSSITLFDLLIANNAAIKQITKSIDTKSIEVFLSDWNVLFPIYHKYIIRQYNLMLNEENYRK